MYAKQLSLDANMALVMLNRMRAPNAETVPPESQCGFRRNRGTTDMIFVVRQLMEKAREQHRNLYIAFLISPQSV